MKTLEFMNIEQPKVIGKAYRYVDILYGDDCHTYVRVYLHDYPIIKETPKGIWINDWSKKRFVNLNARKKFACLTKEDALISFKARKERQIRILESQLRHAKEALSVIGQVEFTK